MTKRLLMSGKMKRKSTITTKCKKTFKFIFDYADKNLICSDCGTHKSVKYMIDDKPFCNLCALINV